MNSSTRFPLVLIIVATISWTGIVALSERVVQPKTGHAPRSQASRVKELEAQVSSATPGTDAQRQKQLELGDALMQEAESSKNPEQIMAAIQQFTAVLDSDPQELTALRSLGDISFRSGVLDKSIGYYQRYLEIEPADLRVQTDLALAFLQSGQNEKAIELLEKVTTRDPKAFPPRLSLALAYKIAGRAEDAKRSAATAREFAPDDEGRQVVDAFLRGLGGTTPTAQSDLSPAQVIDSFFRNHSIVGKKLTAIRWSSDSEVIVKVKEFPVEAMPPFARDKFLANVRNTLQALPQPVTVVIQDADSEKELLRITAEKRG